MENHSDFNQRIEGEQDLTPFRIEVADGNQGRFFSIIPLGSGRYEILDNEESIGTIQLDEKDHLHCESLGCELDMPLLHAIRNAIQTHQQY